MITIPENAFNELLENTVTTLLQDKLELLLREEIKTIWPWSSRNNPPLTWKAIYTTNPIERMNKEIRKRLKPMNSLTNIEAAEKIIYLQVTDYNEAWYGRAIRGFADPETKEAFEKMYNERYPDNPKNEL